MELIIFTDLMMDFDWDLDIDLLSLLCEFLNIAGWGGANPIILLLIKRAQFIRLLDVFGFMFYLFWD